MTRYTGTGSQNSNYTGIIEVTQGSQSVTGNYSMVNIKLILKTGASYYSQTGTTLNLTVNGEKILNADYAQRSVSPNTENILWSGAVKVSHNSDGTKTVAISGSIVTTAGYSYLPGTCSMSGNFMLTTIPRASSFGTISGSTLGSAISIAITRHSSSFTHKLYYDFGTQKNLEIADSAATSASFTPSLDLCSEIPNATSGALTIYMETYSNGTKIGNTVSKTITVNVPASVVPTIGAITVSEAVDDVKTKAGVYVQGLSKLNLAITNITKAYKSEIKSYMIVFEDVRYPTQTAVSDFIKGSGSLKITASVTDTRGRTATKETTINVAAYSPPAFVSVPTAVRQSGTASNVDVISSVSVSSVKNGTTEKNALKLYVLYKLATASSYPSISSTYQVTTSGLSFDNALKTLTGIDASKSYNIKVVLQDNFKETAWELSLGTEIVGYDFNRAGFGIGKYRENGALDVKGDIYANNKLVSVEGHAHTAVKDAGDGVNTTFAFSKDALTTTSWLTVWNNYELRKISPANLKTVLGTPLSHTHAIADITSLQTTLNAKSPLARTVTSLWTGSVQSGTVTVNTALTNFRYLYVTVGTSSSTYATYIIVPLSSSPTQFRGIGGYESPSNGVEIYSLRGTISGTSITLDEVYARNANALATNNGGTRLYMKGIYGVR